MARVCPSCRRMTADAELQCGRCGNPTIEPALWQTMRQMPGYQPPQPNPQPEAQTPPPGAQVSPPPGAYPPPAFYPQPSPYPPLQNTLAQPRAVKPEPTPEQREAWVKTGMGGMFAVLAFFIAFLLAYLTYRFYF